jgi:hypothetical protein
VLPLLLLDVGFISSTNGGCSFSAPVQLAGPMNLARLPQSDLGRMVGDYISTSYSAGKAFPGFAVAKLPTAGTDCSKTGAVCNKAIYTVSGGLSVAGGSYASTSDHVLWITPNPVPGLPTAH